MIVVSSDNNAIEANRFYNYARSRGGVAIRVNGENNEISMNAIYGPFATALTVQGVGTGGGITHVDNNSIMLTANLTSTGITFNSTSGICYRNNIVWGNSASTGLSLVNMRVASTVECGGIGTENNANVNSRTGCSGNGCSSFCSGNKAMCDRSNSPAFQDEQMCLGTSSGLIDTGLEVGLDMWDGSSLTFKGTAPDVGARESGTSRTYGGVVSTCP
jgi:hypothetical protein